MKNSIFDIEIKKPDGTYRTVRDFKGSVMLIVNTASYCGFTPHYKGLQILYDKYRIDGLVVLGFPCNQFGNQEPGSAVEIAEFCKINYQVTFPVFAKINVNGPDTAPLFKFLKSQTHGFLGTSNIKWNFTKFLVDREGKKILRFAPYRKPESLVRPIEKFLSNH